MQIGIFGYGKMGKEVESQLVKSNHEPFILKPESLGAQIKSISLDVIIDFSHAQVAPDLINTALSRGIHVVSGTTGCNQDIDDIAQSDLVENAAFCWAPNFSIGMNIALYLNRCLARIMSQLEDFDAHLLEIHHTEKVDAPSGTAIAMAEDVIRHHPRYSQWHHDNGTKKDTSLSVEAQREKDIKGIHRITWMTDHETISIRHQALRRDVFAKGAVWAAEKISGRRGFFNFSDLLDFQGSC